MKKLIFGILFTFVTTIIYSQVYKFRSYDFQMKTKKDYGWTKWSKPSETNLLIVFNLDNQRVSIYSKETQTYDIYQTYKRFTDDDGDYIFEYACIDADGIKCHIRWIKLNSQNGRLQIYVDYSDMMWMYNVNLIE